MALVGNAGFAGVLNSQGLRAPVAPRLDNLLASLASDYKCLLRFTRLVFLRYVHAFLKGGLSESAGAASDRLVDLIICAAELMRLLSNKNALCHAVRYLDEVVSSCS